MVDDESDRVFNSLYLKNTLPSHNKHTHNKHFSHNKHTAFSLTKMFGEEEDLGKINSLYFFKIESLKTRFFIIFEKLCNAGLNSRFFRQSAHLFPHENVLIMRGHSTL